MGSRVPARGVQAPVARRYVTSKRHTIQVDFDEYLFRLAGERREGARRAAAAGYASQVPALAAAEETVAA